MTPEERFWSNVQKTDSCWLWTKAKNDHGYGIVRWNEGERSRTLGAHRVAYTLAIGPIPPGKLIDHRCHNHSCVNPSHLRLATHKQNGENRAGPRKGTSSGARGVTWDKRAQNWHAFVTHNGRSHSAGSYPTVAEASEAARLKRLELFTHNDADRNSK